jgi:hypothetical protein
MDRITNVLRNLFSYSTMVLCVSVATHGHSPSKIIIPYGSVKVLLIQ